MDRRTHLILILIAAFIVCHQKQSFAGDTAKSIGANPSQGTNVLVRSTHPAGDGRSSAGRISTFDGSGHPDPFFPRRGGKATNNIPVKLHLDGVSFGNTNRLAIINGRTLAVDESAEIRLGPEKMIIRCVQIHEDGTTVEIVSTGERQTLKLKR